MAPATPCLGMHLFRKQVWYHISGLLVQMKRVAVATASSRVTCLRFQLVDFLEQGSQLRAFRVLLHLLGQELGQPDVHVLSHGFGLERRERFARTVQGYGGYVQLKSTEPRGESQDRGAKDTTLTNEPPNEDSANGLLIWPQMQPTVVYAASGNDRGRAPGTTVD